jgi:hypothetical protein
MSASIGEFTETIHNYTQPLENKGSAGFVGVFPGFFEKRWGAPLR